MTIIVFLNLCPLLLRKRRSFRQGLLLKKITFTQWSLISRWSLICHLWHTNQQNIQFSWDSEHWFFFFFFKKRKSFLSQLWKYMRIKKLCWTEFELKVLSFMGYRIGVNIWKTIKIIKLSILYVWIVNECHFTSLFY